MTTPTFAQLSDPTQTGPGFGVESYPERLLTIAAMIASGQNPDGTPSPTLGPFLPISGGTLTGILIALLYDKGGMVYNVKAYGATGNSVTDDTAAIQAAHLACKNAGGGIVFFPAGSYVYSSKLVNNTVGVSWLGAGSSCTFLYPTAITGDTILWQMSPFSTLYQPGTLGMMTISAVNPVQSGYGGAVPSTTMTGLHYGDACNGRFLDLVVSNFSSAGSVGIHMDNITEYTEGTIWDDVQCFNNTVDVMFDVQAGAASTSFGYQRIKRLRMDVNPGQTGVVLKNAASVYNGEINISANISPEVAGSFATFCTITGPGTGFANALFAIHVEQTGGAAGTSYGFQLNDFGILTGAGTIDLSGGAPVSSVSGINPGSTTLSGWMRIPGLIDNTQAAAASAGLTLYTGITQASSLYSGPGAPTIAGVKGDFYFRIDTPTTANQRLYTCSTAGGSGAAVWTALL